MMIERLLQIGADFNAVDADGRVRASSRYATTPEIPAVGEWILLTDADGNACRARVEEVTGVAVSARPDWATWIAGEIARLSRTFEGGTRLGEIGDKPQTEGTTPHATGSLQAA